jgi:hypothetical protein
MAEWFSPIFSGVFSLIGGAIGAAVLAHFFQQRRYHHEQLLARYSEFVATVADELDRAIKCKAMFVLSQHKTEGGKAIWVKLEERRHATRCNLLRAAFQIRLLERDPELSEQVQKLADSQPFIIPGDWHEGSFNERFENYDKEIHSFQGMLDSLIKAVLKKQKLI